ncbi:DUF257 family protein [Thermococcus paralvinellae]|uniref:KaiC-like domain-containing protein n=1 Tax=Thermococcus paralvinellae TaxID=582419 RepID=W0I6M1_9EURY|nr:DUF257 family protein [Thermococcus paralvinellae]AHF80038.1 Hypothetical protein TES1_0650 [Thermococcus paralvinellae]
MSERFESSIFDYAKTIQRGEILLVEYTSNEPIHLIFYIFLKYLKQSNIPFVIIDAVDQLHVFKAHLELVGIDTSIIDEAQVIKLGGVLHTGNIIRRVDLEEDLPIWRQHYIETFRKIQEEKGYVMRIVIGTEKLLKLYERNPLETGNFFGMVVRPFLGDKNTTGVIFLNTSLLDKKTVLEWTEIASRVFDVELKEGEITLRITKSVDFSEYGREIKVKAQELQEYLAR